MKKLYTLALAATAAIGATAAPGEWTVVEDFENFNGTPAIWSWGNQPTGTAAVETVEKDGNADNHAAVFTGGNWETVLEFTVTLEDGKTIADYDAIDFDIYTYNQTQKPVYVNINGTVVKEAGANDVKDDANKWMHFRYDMAVPGTDTEVKIRVGLKINSGSYAVDNIRLKENGDEPVVPVEYHATQNGQTIGGEYVANDFQHHAAIDVALPTWTRVEGSPVGVAKTASDPDDEKNLVAHFQGGDYNTVPEMDVTLPEGKALKNYSQIKFKLYRHADDPNNKKMRVQADDEELYYDEGESYPDQGATGEWQERTYDIPKTTAVGNSFKLRAGIESGENKGNYMIDDVRLVQRKTTGIEDVSAESDMNAAAGAGCITVAGNGTARVYTVDGRMVATLSVAGDAASAAVAPGLYVVALSNGGSVKLMVK